MILVRDAMIDDLEILIDFTLAEAEAIGAFYLLWKIHNN